MDSKFLKYISASGYKLRCKSKCRDFFPVYGDCMCSSCMNNRRKQPSQQVDECIAQAQSGETVHTGSLSGDALDKEENVTFSDDVESTLLSLSDNVHDHTFDDSFQESSFIGNFFSRPVRIFTYEWDVGNVTPPFFGFNPWELFLSQLSIEQKLTRFKLLHGTLHLKIVINGSPFHYGRFFVGVRPTLYDNNTTTGTPATNVQIENAYNNSGGLKFWQPLKTLYSQRKHVFLDPSTNQPAEIIWPFISARNYIDLQDLSTVQRLGVLEWWELNTLRHANGGTDPVRITVFAHMTDVQLTGLTYSDVAWAQSGKVTKKVPTKAGPAKAQSVKGGKKDEYGKDGAVSALATSVAKAASYFTNIPIIGPYARATEVGAGALTNVAKIFGFSRPTQLEDYCSLKPAPVGRMAVISGGDPLVKLSLDPKQELCVDPSTVGLPREDEMSFLHIAKQETLINQFLWTITGTGSTGTIQLIFVNPLATPCFVTDSQVLSTQTAVSFIARPFAYWTGSLRYRIQAVASQFHRGRLLIQYEPNMYTDFSAQEATIATDGEGMNARYSHVLDLSQERDVTFEVNWAQPEAWRPLIPVILFGNLTQNNMVTADGPVNVPVLMPEPLARTAYNGAIRVFVLNDLAAPDDTSNIEINVYVSAGDSFQVAQPVKEITDFGYARDGVTLGPPELPTAQSGSSTFVTSSENLSNQSTEYIINGSYRKEDVDGNSIFMGEVVSSIRSMLKRYCYHRSVSWNAPNDEANFGIYNYWFRQRDFPNGPGIYAGNEGSGITYAVVGSPPASQRYNICAMTYIRYYCQAFGLYRGGVRWKLVHYGSEGLQHFPTMVTRERVQRQALGANEFVTQDQIALHTEVDAIRHSTYAQQMLITRGFHESMNGVDVKLTGVNPTLEYELPYYFNYRYGELHEPQVPVYQFEQNNSLHMHYHNVSKLYQPIPKIQMNATILVTGNWCWDQQFDCYVAGSEDLAFYLFLGAPPLMLNDAEGVTPAQPP